MPKNWLFSMVLACLLLFSDGAATHAANQLKWQVENIGIFSVPEHWQAVDIRQTLRTIQQKSSAEKIDAQAASVLGLQYNLFNPLQNANLQMYQISTNDGKAYRTAALIFYRHGKPMSQDERIYFTRKISPEEQRELEGEVRNFFQEIQPQLALNYAETNNGIVFLKSTPLAYLNVNDRQAYSLGVRCVASFYGLNIPCYLKVYAFDIDGFLHTALLIVNDSERSYWDPLMGKIIQSFEPSMQP